MQQRHSNIILSVPLFLFCSLINVFSSPRKSSS
uniref:Uncharacterized protein n=1 Tax=Anguilla anguilla TaxID=7936 RepID=A0A0E9QWU5_ANGAN